MFNWLWHRKEPSPAEMQVLRALHAGWTLKSHRYLNGTKIYRLHGLSGEQVELADSVVEQLVHRRWVHSNQKFPAATLLLTDAGSRAFEQVERAPCQTPLPLGSRHFF